MDDVCRSQIISNDYADMLAEYQGDLEPVRKKYNTNCINVISPQYAVAHIPVSRFTRDAILDYGYTDLPDCYGLNDLSLLEASEINRIRQIPNYDFRGNGVLIAIIDTGIDYRNAAFKNADGTTRIYSIWDQTIQSQNYPKDFNYGTVYTKEQINEAVQSDNPLNIVPSMDENGHGTFIAGIAGGTPDLANSFSGVATESEFIIVKLKGAKPYLKDYYVIPEETVCYQENDIMFGVEYAVRTARQLGRPISICIAMGTNQGGHDGKGQLGSLLGYVGDIVGISVTIAGGNEGNARHHFYGQIEGNMGFTTMDINVNENEKGFSMEIWGSAPNTYSIDLLSPTGELIPRIPARIGENRIFTLEIEQTTVEVDYILVEPRSGDQLILVKFRDPAPGLWRFRVYGSGDVNLNFHAWLPITQFMTSNAVYVLPNPDTTITSPANNSVPITVTAYNHVLGVIYQEASRGFNRTNVVKPEIAAPGVNVIGPSLDNTYTTMTGTSISAAHTTGVSALMLEWGILKQNYPVLDSVEIKKLYIRGAKRNANQSYPNTVWGYGILDLYNIFASLREGS